jgi:Mlc titration factor MtfA (ptsG expression regulator)
MRFESRRKRHQRDLAGLVFAEEWREMLAVRWPLWQRLETSEQARLEDLVKVFVFEKRWEAANGFEVTDAMRVLIAAQACLLVLELDGDPYRDVGSILVHPTTLVLEGQRTTGTGGLVSSDPYPILGQAQFGGPTILAWDTVAYEARHPARGQNVVFHEFAHKLDMLDGLIDGTPPLADPAARRRWIEVCTREFNALRRGAAGTFLRDYGGENPGEFFAVATEAFFSAPVQMREQKPDLYEVLSGFYRQDPAARFPTVGLTG